MLGPRPISLLLVCLVLVALGCASYSAPAQEPEDWGAAWKRRASRAAQGAAAGAQVVGTAMGTAFHGVTHGFQEPNAKGFGRYPTHYAEVIRSHMTRFAGVPADATFRFRKPEKGYLNDGILAGGSVSWQGYLVEVEVVEDTYFASQRKPAAYVVRMRDGAVVEVIEAEYAGALRWAERRETDSAPAARN